MLFNRWQIQCGSSNKFLNCLASGDSVMREEPFRKNVFSIYKICLLSCCTIILMILFHFMGFLVMCYFEIKILFLIKILMTYLSFFLIAPFCNIITSWLFTVFFKLLALLKILYLFFLIGWFGYSKNGEGPSNILDSVPNFRINRTREFSQSVWHISLGRLERELLLMMFSCFAMYVSITVINKRSYTTIIHTVSSKMT